MNKNITKYLLIALLVMFGLFIVYDCISKLGMFEGMQTKKEGMDDKKKEGMDDKKKEGMDDKKKEGLEEKQRKKTTNQITPFEESSTKSFTEY